MPPAEAPPPAPVVGRAAARPRAWLTGRKSGILYHARTARRRDAPRRQRQNSARRSVCPTGKVCQEQPSGRGDALRRAASRILPDARLVTRLCGSGQLPHPAALTRSDHERLNSTRHVDFRDKTFSLLICCRRPSASAVALRSPRSEPAPRCRDPGRDRRSRRRNLPAQPAPAADRSAGLAQLARPAAELDARLEKGLVDKWNPKGGDGQQSALEARPRHALHADRHARQALRAGPRQAGHRERRREGRLRRRRDRRAALGTPLQRVSDRRARHARRLVERRGRSRRPAASTRRASADTSAASTATPARSSGSTACTKSSA